MLRARSLFILPIAVLSALAALVLVGCTTSTPPQVPNDDHAQVPSEKTDSARQGSTAGEQGHAHAAGAHGGTIISLGRDSYHVEAIVEENGTVRLYTLGNDESRVLAIEAQDLVAYVKSEGATDSTSIEVKPQPQPGDESGKSSLFIGQLPKDTVGKTVEITIPSVIIGGERFRMNFTNRVEVHSGDHMPAAVADKEARELYLTPGGLYTVADIQANGNVTAEQKFKGFQAKHDLKPKVGDKICPVTLTKANPECAWIIGGHTYEFCCPPCVDEFVALAKSKPEEVQPPDHYVKREAAKQAE